MVDDNRDRVFLDAIEQKFRGLRSEIHGGVLFVRKVKFGGSGPDELLQLADMACGAVSAHLHGDSAWHKMIDSRTLGVKRYPEMRQGNVLLPRCLIKFDLAQSPALPKPCPKQVNANL